MLSSRLCWAIYAGSWEGEAGKALSNLMVFRAHGGGLQSFSFLLDTDELQPHPCVAKELLLSSANATSYECS